MDVLRKGQPLKWTLTEMLIDGESIEKIKKYSKLNEEEIEIEGVDIYGYRKNVNEHESRSVSYCSSVITY